MEFKINHCEQSALRGLPFIQRVLYVFALRPYMDYASGIVGIKRKVSYQSLREELYVEPHPGIQSGSPSKQQIQRALDGLERAGLIRRHQKNKLRRELILKCCLATVDHYIKNKPDANPINKAEIKLHQNKYLQSKNYNKNQNKDDSLEMIEGDIPPVSGNIDTLSLKNSEETEISDHFQPSKKIIAKAKQYQCPTADCRDELMRFIAYHQSKGSKRHDWDAEFLGWLLRAKQYHREKNHANKKSRTTKRSSNRTSNLSAVDRVLKANQALIDTEARIIEHHS